MSKNPSTRPSQIGVVVGLSMQQIATSTEAKRGITMSININNEKNIPIDTDACYEELASQEELYLEETEVEVVAILTSYVASASQDDHSIVDICAERESDLEIEGAMIDQANNPHMAENLDERLVEASEELITGDADDPPLSEDSVRAMLNDSIARGSDR
jgi:hypothetical protein